MQAIYPEIINRLDSKKLEEIFTLNKIKIQGFRSNGPSSPVKTLRMKRILTSNPKLEMILKNTAKKYSETKNKDLSWALVSELNNEKIKSEISGSGLAEVTYALLEANKIWLLEDVLFESIDEVEVKKKEVKEVKEVKKDNKNNTESDIKIAELRKFIFSLEEDKRLLKQEIKLIENKYKKEISEKKELSQKIITNNELNEKLKKEVYKQKQAFEIIKEELEKNTIINNTYLSLIEKLKKEISNTKKVNIVFYGTRYYERLIVKKSIDIQNVDLVFVNDLSKIEKTKDFQKLVILDFTLNTKERADYHNEDIVNYYQGLFDLVILSSIEQLEEYLFKVENYNE